MKTAQQWFDEYAVSHQNLTNQNIHFLCVPAIFFSVIGLLMSIPTSILENIFELDNPLLENWAAITSIFILIFYLRLGFWYFVQMLFFICLSITALTTRGKRRFIMTLNFPEVPGTIINLFRDKPLNKA